MASEKKAGGIAPPKTLKKVILVRAKIFYCDNSKKATVGLYWYSSSANKFFFDFVHGYILSPDIPVNEIVEKCRKQCPGLLVAGELADKGWKNFLNSRKNSVARLIFEI